jgi:ribonucrease Y
MSLKLVFLLLGASAVVGAAIGYVFRWLFVLARKGSIELEVKQLLMTAREDAKKITAAAEEEAKQKLASIEGEIKEKEEKVLRAEDRVFKREEALDKRQSDLDRELEGVKSRIEEIKAIKERADILLSERGNALAAVAGLTKEEAKNKLYEELEREASDDLMIRVQKLEQTGQEKLERRAKDILTTAIHRLGNSVASDTMATAIAIARRALKSLSTTLRARSSFPHTTLSAARSRASHSRI